MGLALTINELVSLAHNNATEKGFHDVEVDFPKFIALLHSEITEAFEEHRSGHDINETYFNEKEIVIDTLVDGTEISYPKPEGIPTELADLIIRIADYCGEHEINLENAIVQKMIYNRYRPRMHGKKY